MNSKIGKKSITKEKKKKKNNKKPTGYLQYDLNLLYF